MCIQKFNMKGYQSRYQNLWVERQNMYKKNEEQRPNEEESSCKKEKASVCQSEDTSAFREFLLATLKV